MFMSLWLLSKKILVPKIVGSCNLVLNIIDISNWLLESQNVNQVPSSESISKCITNNIQLASNTSLTFNLISLINFL